MFFGFWRPAIVFILDQAEPEYLWQCLTVGSRRKPLKNLLLSCGRQGVKIRCPTWKLHWGNEGGGSGVYNRDFFKCKNTESELNCHQFNHVQLLVRLFILWYFNRKHKSRLRTKATSLRKTHRGKEYKWQLQPAALNTSQHAALCRGSRNKMQPLSFPSPLRLKLCHTLK